MESPLSTIFTVLNMANEVGIVDRGIPKATGHALGGATGFVSHCVNPIYTQMTIDDFPPRQTNHDSVGIFVPKPGMFSGANHVRTRVVRVDPHRVDNHFPTLTLLINLALVRNLHIVLIGTIQCMGCQGGSMLLGSAGKRLILRP